MRKFRFQLVGRSKGREITPSNIGLDLFNRFDKEVEEFLAGAEHRVPLDHVHVAIEDGSYALSILLPPSVTSAIEPDVRRLAEGGGLLDGIDRRRAPVVRRWQDWARTEGGPTVNIQPDREDFRPVRIAPNTDFHLADQDDWVATEKYVIGRLTDVGGSTRVNVHLVPDEGGRTIIAASTEDYLRGLRKNGEGPSYDEEESQATRTTMRPKPSTNTSWNAACRCSHRPTSRSSPKQKSRRRASS